MFLAANYAGKAINITQKGIEAMMKNIRPNMNEMIIKDIVEELGVSEKQVNAVLTLLSEDNTIPFIARYRKEATGSLDEVAIRNIQLRYEELQELIKRKSYILDTIREVGALTSELEEKINATYDSAILEDLFLPYKPKRRTRAAIARERGLEPLAKIIMSQNEKDIESRAERFLSDEVACAEEAITGAQDIIAEWVSESETARQIVRTTYERNAIVASQIVKGKEAEAENYLNYKDRNYPTGIIPYL